MILIFVGVFIIIVVIIITWMLFHECYIIIIIIPWMLFIIIIIEFLTYQLQLGNIHPSWDAVINRIRLGGLICSLKSFLQLNMCQELQIFAAVYMYWGASWVLLDFVIVTLELLL